MRRAYAIKIPISISIEKNDFSFGFIDADLLVREHGCQTLLEVFYAPKLWETV